MTREEITGGREPRRWIRPLAALALLVVITAVVGDRLVRRHERQSLRHCVVHAELDLDDLSFRIAGLEIYIASAVDRPDIAPSVRRSLRGIVQESVLRGLPPLQRDQSRCEAVRAWHSASKDGRGAYLAYLELRMQQLQRAEEDIDALHVVVPELASARATARTALAAVGVSLTP